jgi:hypothetical protein
MCVIPQMLRPVVGMCVRGYCEQLNDAYHFAYHLCISFVHIICAYHSAGLLNFVYHYDFGNFVFFFLFRFLVSLIFSHHQVS